jgi:hypothetical protein
MTWANVLDFTGKSEIFSFCLSEKVFLNERWLKHTTAGTN